VKQIPKRAVAVAGADGHGHGRLLGNVDHRSSLGGSTENCARLAVELSCSPFLAHFE
jgi:hypothetical protein